jgi:hypothetical protein
MFALSVSVSLRSDCSDGPEPETAQDVLLLENQLYHKKLVISQESIRHLAQGVSTPAREHQTGRSAKSPCYPVVPGKPEAYIVIFFLASNRAVGIVKYI